MKAIKKWRYYCDFCKKAGGSKFHMENHEKSCTLNPDRICKFCHGLLEDDVQQDTDSLLNAIVEDYNCYHEKSLLDEIWDPWQEKPTFNYLRKITNCPACILTAIRIASINDLDGFYPDWDFDYNEESGTLRAKIYQEQQEEYRSIIGCVDY